MSFFLGNSGLALRHQWASVVPSQLSLATGQSTAIMLAYLGRGARFAYFDNTLNADLSLWLISPNADPTQVASRLFWIELPQNRVINYDFLQQLQVEFDPGTTIMVSVVAGETATTGKLRMSAFA